MEGQTGVLTCSGSRLGFRCGELSSHIGDAYSLAASFGSDFSKMLVTGKTPLLLL
ncbi:MAG: hypothetical protein AAAC47_21250 [Pararhizobium sp.]